MGKREGSVCQKSLRSSDISTPQTWILSWPGLAISGSHPLVSPSVAHTPCASLVQEKRHESKKTNFYLHFMLVAIFYIYRCSQLNLLPFNSPFISSSIGHVSLRARLVFLLISAQCLKNFRCFIRKQHRKTYLSTENTRAILPIARILFLMTSFRAAAVAPVRKKKFKKVYCKNKDKQFLVL